MFKIIVWILIIGGIFYAHQAGWLNALSDYFSKEAQEARQEQVIEDDNGNIIHVKYRSPVDRLLREK